MDLRRVSSGKSVRLVEESGQQLRSILCKADPWSGTSCRRPQCTTCPGEERARGKCRDRNLVYMNTCKECKKMERTSRYIGETNRSLWERNLEHQADALNPAKKSHIRDHVTTHHPQMLQNMLEVFSITVIKPTRSALQRQVREAVEIARDRSYILLNSKEEYNRCLVPTIVMEGPSHPKRQAEIERDLDHTITRLTREQEEEAIAQAKTQYKKKRQEDREMRREETKRIRMDRSSREGGGEEDGLQKDDGGGGETSTITITKSHTIQTDIRSYARSPSSTLRGTNRDDKEMNANDDCDEDGAMMMMRPERDDPSGKMMTISDDDGSREEVDDQSNLGRIISNIQGPISSKAKFTQSIKSRTVRPPTRTRVKKCARRRFTQPGGDTRDIRNFFLTTDAGVEKG